MKAWSFTSSLVSLAALVGCSNSGTPNDTTGVNNAANTVPESTSTAQTDSAATGAASSGATSAPGPSGTTTASAGASSGATGVGATGVGATGIGATGVGATGVGATGVGATGVGATGVGATGVGATGVGATGVGATGVGATGVGTTGTTSSPDTSSSASADGGAPDLSVPDAPHPKFIGNIAPKNQEIPADFAEKWMQMSMEANSKWGFVQPDSADQWVWDPVDEAHQFAADNALIFKQHNFFWNFEQPGWVTSGNVATVGPLWVKAFCERYPDVPMIDVVNEPIHNAAPYRDGMGGAGASGYDWVVQAFQWAREYCPNSILIINEFNIIEWEADHEKFKEALRAMLAAGAPIDAIGAQGHDVYRAGTEQAKIYIDALVQEFHLPIYVTELDIDLSNDQEQLESMQTVIPMLWDHPAVHGITYWGFLQGKTWRTNAWLVSTSGTERPAMTWLQQFIADHR